MKILFVSLWDPTKASSSGGSFCTSQNYRSICTMAGAANVACYTLVGPKSDRWFNRIMKKFWLLLGYFWDLDPLRMREILRAAQGRTHVFIEPSMYGNIARYLVQHGYTGKIIIFFHNVESELLPTLQSDALPWLNGFMAKRNERLALRYASRIVCLNQRDLDALKRLHADIAVHNSLIIPIHRDDTVRQPLDCGEFVGSPLRCLFLGSYFTPNVNGLEWFIRNVLDHAPITLDVVGSGMERLNAKWQHPRLSIRGFVADLQDCIAQADVLVFPIFEGSGMKVKTSDALMYGKNIIGTPESFEGYTIDPQYAGACCSNSDEFIAALIQMEAERPLRYNSYCRNAFVEHYSSTAVSSLWDLAFQ